MSPAQFQALEDVERSGDPAARVRGQSQHGGWNGVMRVIVNRQKWIWYTGQRWALTKAGKAALAAERARRGL